jgi:hypothetical protein
MMNQIQCTSALSCKDLAHLPERLAQDCGC